MLVNYFIHNIQAQARSFANFFGCEKWLENVILNFAGNSWTVVHDLNQCPLMLARRTHNQLTVLLHGIDSVVDQVRPNLVQRASESADLGQRAIELAGYL